MSWHAASVHLPIALALVAPLVDGAGLALKRPAVAWTGVVLLGVAALSSLVSTATGQSEYDSAVTAGHAVEVLNRHADLASFVPWALLAALALRLWLPTQRPKWGAWAGMILSLGLIVLVVRVGQTGGALVYEHGVGVPEARTQP